MVLGKATGYEAKVKLLIYRQCQEKAARYPENGSRLRVEI